MDSLKTTVLRVMQLAERANDTSKAIDSLYGYEVENSFESMELEHVMEKNVPQLMLVRYLESLSSERVSEIWALMFSGRDEEDFELVKEDAAKYHKEEMIQTILDKQRSLTGYLGNGLSKIELSPLDNA